MLNIFKNGKKVAVQLQQKKERTCEGSSSADTMVSGGEGGGAPGTGADSPRAHGADMVAPRGCGDPPAHPWGPPLHSR